MKKKLGKGEPLDIKFYSGKTKDGLQKTIARCAVKLENIPEKLIKEGYLVEHVDYWREPLTTLYAETICKNGDTYDKYTGELIVRKKIIRAFLNYLETFILYRAHKLEDARNDICDYIDFLESTKDSITEYLKKF